MKKVKKRVAFAEMDELPKSMEALAVSEYGQPSTYQKISLDTPSLAKPHDVIIRVHASSVNPIDVKFAAGMAKRIQPAT